MAQHSAHHANSVGGTRANILAYLKARQRRTLTPPSLQKIADIIGISLSTAHYHVDRLRDSGEVAPRVTGSTNAVYLSTAHPAFSDIEGALDRNDIMAARAALGALRLAVMSHPAAA